MGVVPRKSARDALSMDLYVNKKMRKGIELCNKIRVEAGEIKLSERQFILTATQEKIQRELSPEARADIGDDVNTKYPLLSDEERSKLSELPEL
jgi:hypothetical protein